MGYSEVILTWMVKGMGHYSPKDGSIIGHDDKNSCQDCRTLGHNRSPFIYPIDVPLSL